MMKPSRVVIILLFFSFLFGSCQKEEYIKVLVQQKLKLNENYSLKIRFKKLPDKKNSLFIQPTDDFILEKAGAWITDINTETGDSIITYSTFITPKRKGIINLPIITAKFNGKTITSERYIVEVLNDIEITEDAVILEWKSDRRIYSQKDSIVVELYEYSSFVNTRKIPVKNGEKSNLSNIQGDNNNLNISAKITPSFLSGINDFDTFINNGFEVVSFDIDPFRVYQTIEEKEGKYILKT